MDSSTDGDDDETEVLTGVDPTRNHPEVEGGNEIPQGEPLVRRILQTLVIFLSFFQLKFHIPERGMTMLLKFIHGLIKTIALIASPTSALVWLKDNFPSSTFLLKKHSGAGSLVLKEFVLCSKCHSMYNLEDCINSTSTPKQCQYVAYPNHPHISRREPCNSVLMKKVKHDSSYKYVDVFVQQYY